MALKTWVFILAVALALSVGFTAGYVVRGSSDAGAASVESTIGVVVVPALVGLAQAEAQRVVEASGLAVTVRATATQTVPRGVVVEQDPPAGVRVPRGTMINLSVSER